jgi:predicted ATP-grasp superfamily ATP-dependent carboligase
LERDFVKSLSRILFLSLSLSPFFMALGDDSQKRFENRLNELMFWRLSDELALKPQEEQKLKNILKKYQEERKKALLQQQEAIAVMADPKKCKNCLKSYEDALNAFGQSSPKEFKELRAALGEEKLKKFILIRSQMTNDVKEALRAPTQQANDKK